jgi:hypothetical protein
MLREVEIISTKERIREFMPFIIEIKISDNTIDALEVVNMMKGANIEIRHAQGLHERGANFPVELVLALSSAGTFTALYQVICKLIEKNKDREIMIRRGDTQVIIKGHKISEENQLLQELLPELAPQKTPKKRKKKIRKTN